MAVSNNCHIQPFNHENLSILNESNELSLHMTSPDRPSVHNPKVFSRGSIQLTYDLLRPINPQLALTVRNLMHQTPEVGNSDNKNADHFQVALDSFDVRAIVECISGFIEDPKNKTNQGMLIMAKALLEDWIALASQMLSEYRNHRL